MAFVQGYIVFEPVGVEHPEYNLDYPIGPGRTNRQDDIMLAQALLRIIFYETNYADKNGCPRLPDIDDIPLSGNLLPELQRYIVHFKNWMRQWGYGVYPDAVILPYPPIGLKKSSVTRTYFTMRLLLNFAWKADADAGLGKVDSLAYLDEIPELLRTNLQRVGDRAPGYREGT
jgi:hypothetical protein